MVRLARNVSLCDSSLSPSDQNGRVGVSWSEIEELTRTETERRAGICWRWLVGEKGQDRPCLAGGKNVRWPWDLKTRGEISTLLTKHQKDIWSSLEQFGVGPSSASRLSTSQKEL